MSNNKKDIKVTDYIVNVFATHVVLLESPVFLGDKTWMNCKNAILPRLVLSNRKYTVLTCVMDELKEKARMASPADTEVLAQRAKKALADIDDHIHQGLCEVVDDGLKVGFADAGVYKYCVDNRFDRNLLVITRDKQLAKDVLALNDLQSARSYRSIKVWYLEDSGFLNTHYDWNREVISSFNHSRQFNKHNSSRHVDENPVKERVCVTCKKDFKLTDAQIAAKKLSMQNKFPAGRFGNPKLPSPVAAKPVVNGVMNCSDCEDYSPEKCQACRDNAKQTVPQGGVRAKAPKKFEEPVEKLTCVDCGSVFDLTASNKRYFVLKGMVPPKRCPACRKRIKDAMNQHSVATSVNTNASSNECVGVYSGGAAHSFFSGIGGLFGSF